MICSEAKKQQGDLLSDNNIKDYTVYEYLRPDMQEGGMVVYIKDDLTVIVETWDGLGDPQEQWMDSERLWLIIKTESESMAVCSSYLRCQNYKKPELYNDNKKLTNKIEEEAAYLRNTGCKVTWWGDMNGHIGRLPPLGITKNCHPGINQNGRLILEHVSEMGMVILNGNQWTREDGIQVKARGEHTYQKIRKDGVHRSYIDLAFADKEALKHINMFEVIGFEAHVPGSDHVPMLMSLGLHGEKPETTQEQQKKPQAKTQWDAFKNILEERLKLREQSFMEGSVGHQSELLTQNITAAYESASIRDKKPRKKFKNKQKRRTKLPRKLRKIIWEKKESLKRLHTKMNQAQDYTEERETYLQLRTAEQIEQIKCTTDRKFKLRQICRGKSPNAVKMFWSCIKGTRPGMVISHSEALSF